MGKYDHWSLDNWPEKWIHDDWDDEERRRSQQVMGHEAIYRFFQKFPEFNNVVPYIFDKGNVTVSFFSGELMIILKTLSRLSRNGNRCISHHASGLVNRIVSFIMACNDPTSYLFDTYETFLEGFYLLGEEKGHLRKLLPPEAVQKIESFELAAGESPDVPLDEWMQAFVEKSQKLVLIVEQDVTNMCK